MRTQSDRRKVRFVLLRRLSVVGPVAVALTISASSVAQALAANTFHMAQVGRVSIQTDGSVLVPVRYLCPDGAQLGIEDVAQVSAMQFRAKTGEVSRLGEAQFDPVCDGELHTIVARVHPDGSEVRFSRARPLNVSTSLTVTLPDSERTVTAYDYKWVVGDGVLVVDIDVKAARVLDAARGVFRVRLAEYCRRGGAAVEEFITLAFANGSASGETRIPGLVCDGSWHHLSTRVQLPENTPLDTTAPLAVYARMTVGYTDLPTPPFGMISEDQTQFRLE